MTTPAPDYLTIANGILRKLLATEGQTVEPFFWSIDPKPLYGDTGLTIPLTDVEFSYLTALEAGES